MRETDKAPDAFRTISEVAEELDLPQHVLRFWESRFTQIKPVKRAGGRRFYRPDDVDLLRGIRQLLYSDGYTIKGVQRILKEQGIRHVQDLGVEQTAAVMRSDVRPPAPATGREEGTTFGGLLGLLPRRKAKPQDDVTLPDLPPTAELPLPFPDAEADHDLSAHHHPEDPVPLRTPQRAEPRLDARHRDEPHVNERHLDERLEPQPAPRRQGEPPPERRAHRGRGGDEALPPGRSPHERIDPTFAPPPEPDGYFPEVENPEDDSFGEAYPPLYPQAEPPRREHRRPPAASARPAPATRPPGQRVEPPLETWSEADWEGDEAAMRPPAAPPQPRQQQARPAPATHAPAQRVEPPLHRSGPTGEAWSDPDWGDDEDAMRPPVAPLQSRQQQPARPAPGVPQPRPSRGPASRIATPPPEVPDVDAWPEPEDLPPILPPILPPVLPPVAPSQQRVAYPPAASEPAPRPTRGPAAQPVHPAPTPELEDPLLPFFDQDVPDSGAVSEPIEERIRRLKARVEGPPPEFIPARARPPQPSPPVPPAYSGPPAEESWPEEEHLPPLRPLAARRPAPAPQPHSGAPRPATPPFGAPQGWRPPVGPAHGPQGTPYNAPGPGPEADPHWSGWAGEAMPLPPYRPAAATGQGGLRPSEPARLPPGADSPRWPAAPWEAPAAAAPPPPFPDPRAPISPEPIPGWLRAPVSRYGEGPQPPFADGSGQPHREGGAHDPRTAPPPEPARQGPAHQGPPEQYLPPHLRADPRAPGQPPMAAPVLSRDDVYRLQAALYELGECRRLMDDALDAEAGEES